MNLRGTTLAVTLGGLALVSCRREPSVLIGTTGLGVERIVDTAGGYQTVTRGVRYLILTSGANADSATFSVLEERTETRCCTVSEHPTHTAVTLSRLDRAPDGSIDRPWTWTGSFDEGEIWDKFYHGTEWGCCDALDLGTLISMETGQTTLRFAHENEVGGESPTWFQLPDQGIARYFGLVEPYQFEKRDSAIQRSAFAIVEMSDGRAAPRRWVLYPPPAVGSCCRFGSLRLAEGGTTGPGSKYLNRWDRTPGKPEQVTGFDLIIDLRGYDDPDVALRIPVVNDEFRPESMRGGRGWRLERLP